MTPVGAFGGGPYTLSDFTARNAPSTPVRVGPGLLVFRVSDLPATERISLPRFARRDIDGRGFVKMNDIPYFLISLMKSSINLNFVYL